MLLLLYLSVSLNVIGSGMLVFQAKKIAQAQGARWVGRGN